MSTFHFKHLAMSTDFQIGDWVTYLPEPEKEFEIIASVTTPYRTEGGPLLSESISVTPGFDFLLKRGGYFKGLEPYKSVHRANIRLLPAQSK
jgi:hypothetical protein